LRAVHPVGSWDLLGSAWSFGRSIIVGICDVGIGIDNNYDVQAEPILEKGCSVFSIGILQVQTITDIQHKVGCIPSCWMWPWLKLIRPEIVSFLTKNGPMCGLLGTHCLAWAIYGCGSKPFKHTQNRGQVDVHPRKYGMIGIGMTI
jgi:hypothetical protein